MPAHRPLRALLSLGAFLLSLSCSGGGKDSGPTTPVVVTPVVTTITVTLSASSIQVGQIITASATATDQNGAAIAATFSWLSADPNVATVSTSGAVTAVKVGTVQISASAGSKQGVATLTVLPPAVTTVVITPSIDTVWVGSSVSFSATPYDAAGKAMTGQSVTWKSYSNAIAVVSGAGTVMGMSLGSTSIEGAIADKYAVGTIVVILPPSKVATGGNWPSGQTMTVNTAVGTLPSVLVTDANNKPVADVAVTFTVTSCGGTITGAQQVTNAAGVATVGSWTLGPLACVNTLTATVQGLPTVTFTVTAVGVVTTVTVSPSSASINTGATQQFTASITDAAGTAVSGATAAWTSSNTAVATVSSSGLATAVAAGTTTITATSGTKSGTATLTVNNSVPLVFTSLSAGLDHTCGLTSAGTAYCWGYNSYGQLGDGTQQNYKSKPTAVSGGLLFVGIAAGDMITCGLTASGTAYCWGNLAYRWQLGGSAANTLTPTAISGAPALTSIDAGAHACGLTSAGAAYCWGYNAWGQVGDGTQTNRSVAVAVSGGLAFSSLSVGSNHTCGLTGTGTAYCWGGSSNITGATTSKSAPGAVVGGLAYSKMAAGFSHTCGRATTGTLYCWGTNTDGQLGDATSTDRTAPVTVTGGVAFAAVAAGGHSCGLNGTGAAYCWGRGFDGQLGNASQADRNTPVGVQGGLVFSVITAGYAHSCGLTSAGVAYCWGSNGSFQLGDGTNTNRLTPVPVIAP